jgi:CDP-paratose 2-epimerase
MLEAIALCQQISGRQLEWQYVQENRAGDHIWWISDIRRFQSHYPSYCLQYGVPDILREIHDQNAERWQDSHRAVRA